MTTFEDPFRASTAMARGALTRHQLRSDYSRVYPDVYRGREAELNARAAAVAAWNWANGGGCLAGWSAAAILGCRWIPDGAPAEIVVPGHVRAPRGLIVHRSTLGDGEAMRQGGLAITSPARTAFDLGRRLSFDDAVEAVDSICHVTRTPLASVCELAERHRGVRGVVQLRAVLQLADVGAESPWETATRLVFVRAGPPRPETQIEVFDANGRLIARVDMGWRRWKVAVEYDGIQHWDRVQRNIDLARWNGLEAAGWRVIRVNASQLRLMPAELVGHARQFLRERGHSS